MAFRSCAGLPSLVLAYGWDATFFALTILIMCTPSSCPPSILPSFDSRSSASRRSLHIG